MTFAIYVKNDIGSDNLLETYTFSFEYPENDVPKFNGNPMDRDSMKAQAVSFIRCLVDFSGTLEELPKERWLTLKLTVF